MKKIAVTTTYKKMQADIFTPVGIYLRLRDNFRDTILLESTDRHSAENSFSIIGINAIGGIEVRNKDLIELKYPGHKEETIHIDANTHTASLLWNYMQRYDCVSQLPKTVKIAQSVFGYTCYDAVQLFDSIVLKASADAIPLMRYRFYQYLIVIDHFKDEMYLCENKIAGIESDVERIEALIKNKNVPLYPFKAKGEEASDISDADYIAMVKQGIKACNRGDVFQVVLSRLFSRKFAGDEFNVYRALRSINPSPYLFYFDYSDYKLMGSSPEAQVVIQNDKAILHPIAGTFKRTGDEQQDKQLAEQLLNDAKENAEHVMLVDLARNDLSRHCDNVQVSHFKQVHYYSHVIHLVSEVVGDVVKDTDPFTLMASTFPAGTLSGAPKFKAMQIINEQEVTNRGYYGGSIGFIGFDGSCNHAIMIRTFLSSNNTLHYRAGAGVVSASVPESELQEVHNKLNALKMAVVLAENL